MWRLSADDVHAYTRHPATHAVHKRAMARFRAHMMPETSRSMNHSTMKLIIGRSTMTSARPPIDIKSMNASACLTASKLCNRFFACCSFVAVFRPYRSPPVIPLNDEGSPWGVRLLRNVDLGGDATIAWYLSPAMSLFKDFHTSSLKVNDVGCPSLLFNEFGNARRLC